MDNVSNQNLKLLEYINEGFSAKKQEKYEEAIIFFEKALKLGPNLDLETMLVFDLVSMLKEFGRYEALLKCLNDFVKKNTGNLPPSILKETLTNLKYYQFLSELLSKAQMSNLPIGKIPTIIIMSAENKLKEWENTNN